MSLQLVLASLFPPKDTDLEWNSNFNWQPIPFVYEEISKDSLLLVNLPCKRFIDENERVVEEDLKKEKKNYPKLFEEFSNHTGFDNFTIMNLMSVYSTLKLQESYLDLKNWIIV